MSLYISFESLNKQSLEQKSTNFDISFLLRLQKF